MGLNIRLWTTVASECISFLIRAMVLFQAACVSQYEHNDLAEFLESLWASLRREVCGDIWNEYKKIKFSEEQTNEEALSLQVFQTASEKIESASLAAVTALTSCLSRSVLKSDSEDPLRSFLDLVLTGEVNRSAH